MSPFEALLLTGIVLLASTLVVLVLARLMARALGAEPSAGAVLIRRHASLPRQAAAAGLESTARRAQGAGLEALLTAPGHALTPS